MNCLPQPRSDRLSKPIRPIIRYAVKVGNFQWVQFPPGVGSRQPEAVGAVVEVTKLLKYFDATGHVE